MKHYEFEMSLYIDGELPKEEEANLFSHLTECGECRKVFLSLHKVKKMAKDHFTKKLEIPDKKEKAEGNIYKYSFYAASAAAVFLLIFFLNRKPVTVYTTKNEMRVDTIYIRKEKPELKIVKKERVYPEANQKNYVHYVMNLPTYKITEKDKSNSSL